MQVEALEKCYYGFEVKRPGQKFEWVKPKWAVKEKLSDGKALPKYLIPVKLADQERVAKDRGEELPVRDEQEDDSYEGSGDASVDGSVKDSKILEAANNLNHDEDAHWTQKGLPDTNAITEKVGFKVTRAEVTALLPELVRDEQEED
tara:strand:- start:1893 stop:2333 length:441 start_codon:yes stop_codon:yes gene_type:complete